MRGHGTAAPDERSLVRGLPALLGCHNPAPHEAARAERRHHRSGERRGRHPVRHRGAGARGDGAQLARAGADGELHLHVHQRPRRRVSRGGRAPARPIRSAAPVRTRDRRSRRPPARDPAAAALLCRPRQRAAPRVPARGGVAAPGPPGSAVTGLEFNARVRDIPVYPAAATYAFDGELVKLASNETPFQPHPQVLEAVEAHLRTLNRYPDPERSALRRRLSERTGVAVGRIAVGNGSCELLLAAVTVPLNDAGEHDLESMAREVTAATRIAIVCNPNNPTATALPPAAIDRFVGELPRHVAVILDEAYVEFSSLQDPDESIALLDRHPNLILLRTFSKVYGLCGLRVG